MTFREKILSKHDLPKIKKAPKTWGGGSMLIPHPASVMNLIDLIPKKQILDIVTFRSILALQHDVDICCPLTTGIFVKHVVQGYQEGSIRTPYWRVFKAKGELDEKFPGGIDSHKDQLICDGLSVIQKRNKHYVETYRDFLFTVK